MGKLNATILLRSDTSTNWLDANPILAMGEAGYETDTHKLKIGNGTTNWEDLSYIASENDLVVQNKSIETVEKLPPEGDASFFYKVKSTSLIYFWDNDKFVAINEKQEIPDPEPQIDNIIVADTKDGFPANGENNKLYKSLDDQLIYSWNSQNNSYEKIKSETVSQINNIKLIMLDLVGVLVFERDDVLNDKEDKIELCYIKLLILICSTLGTNRQKHIRQLMKLSKCLKLFRALKL